MKSLTRFNSGAVLFTCLMALVVICWLSSGSMSRAQSNPFVNSAPNPDAQAQLDKLVPAKPMEGGYEEYKVLDTSTRKGGADELAGALNLLARQGWTVRCATESSVFLARHSATPPFVDLSKFNHVKSVFVVKPGAPVNPPATDAQ